MHKKLAEIIGKCDNEYQLSGQIELDNAFINSSISHGCKDEDLKPSASSQNKSRVVVVTERV
jgi:hypothetical protein